ncbi:MAG TPA: hypothetical protein VEG60_34150 [Candidatus Binatia bacterium]|nr:hypothetical protein [Candidatus Binatia bacterium]
MAKSMTRSRNQIASAYAPESFFTFEGGLGACIAKSILSRKAELDADTRDQIALRMDELIRSWYAAARNCRQVGKPEVLPLQCLEKPLLTDYGEVAPFNEDRFVYFLPNEMGYIPAPLTFVCKTCKLVRTYRRLEDLEKSLDILENQDKCPHPKGKQGRCDWRQLDVVLVHWSGNWENMMPHQWNWSPEKKDAVLYEGRCVCGGQDFTLEQHAPAIGEWFFRCASCGRPLSEKPFQNDPDTIRILGHRMTDPANLTAARMEITSYRASQVHYVQADQFINFRDDKSKRLRLLLPGNIAALEDFIAQRFGFDRAPLSEVELEKAIKDAKLDAEWDKFKSQMAAIVQLEGMVSENPVLEVSLQAAKRARDDIIRDWESRGIVRPKVTLPSALHAGIVTRTASFASRYDPFRLAVEHVALKETKLDPNAKKGGRRAFVPFDRLDEDLAPASEVEKKRVEDETRSYLDQLGIQTMGLVREFDLCRFSFGYSRVSPVPVLKDKRHLDMPVRLRLFPSVYVDDKVRYPVYVITQANEAFYVQLNEDMVYEWLRRLSCGDFFSRGSAANWRIGAGLLEAAPAFDRHLQNLRRSASGSVYYYTYTLLHTYAHVIMKQISEFSGLDLGSLGEYIFPADVAFVVYRSGTTMDLGNLSALWRNSNISFLRSLLRNKTLECGSGSLCVHRGGACPDCIMVPETSCIAGNSLLSRSVLRGYGRPKLDDRPGVIEGFLNVVNELLSKKAA